MIPPALEQVVMRCLEKRREDRFPDVKAMRQAMWESIGVADRRLYLRRCVQGAVSLGEAPTLPPGALAAFVPARVPPVSRGRWLATGALAGVAIPLMAILLRAPVLTAVAGPRPARCAAPLAATARPSRPAAEPSLRLATSPPAPVARPSSVPTAAAPPAPDPRLRPGLLLPEPPATGGAREERHSPYARRARLPPAAVDQPDLDRTVDPFSLEKAARPAQPVAVRDGI